MTPEAALSKNLDFMLATIFPTGPSQQTRIGAVLKRNGMAKAAKAKTVNLECARVIALELGRKFDVVTADDVRRVFEVRHPELGFGNWAGSIFRDGRWDFVDYAESATPARHRGIIRQWRMKT